MSLAFRLHAHQLCLFTRNLALLSCFASFTPPPSSAPYPSRCTDPAQLFNNLVGTKAEMASREASARESLATARDEASSLQRIVEAQRETIAGLEEDKKGEQDDRTGHDTTEQDRTGQDTTG